MHSISAICRATVLCTRRGRPDPLPEEQADGIMSFNTEWGSISDVLDCPGPRLKTWHAACGRQFHHPRCARIIFLQNYTIHTMLTMAKWIARISSYQRPGQPSSISSPYAGKLDTLGLHHRWGSVMEILETPPTHILQPNWFEFTYLLKLILFPDT